jgi:ABC-type glutathione transport system ATPase component
MLFFLVIKVDEPSVDLGSVPDLRYRKFGAWHKFDADHGKTVGQSSNAVSLRSSFCTRKTTQNGKLRHTMNRVGKIVPPKRQILKDISLSFFLGAKIGVLGLNGSGKSTLLKIMAGIDKDIQGEAVPMPNIKIGYLSQEPELNPNTRARIRGIGHGRSVCCQSASGRSVCRVRR